MPATVRCPNCGKPTQLPLHELGQTVRCWKCGRAFETTPHEYATAAAPVAPITQPPAGLEFTEVLIPATPPAPSGPAEASVIAAPAPEQPAADPAPVPPSEPVAVKPRPAEPKPPEENSPPAPAAPEPAGARPDSSPQAPLAAAAALPDPFADIPASGPSPFSDAPGGRKEPRPAPLEPVTEAPVAPGQHRFSFRPSLHRQPEQIAGVAATGDAVQGTGTPATPSKVRPPAAETSSPDRAVDRPGDRSAERPVGRPSSLPKLPSLPESLKSSPPAPPPPEPTAPLSNPTASGVLSASALRSAFRPAEAPPAPPPPTRSGIFSFDFMKASPPPPPAAKGPPVPEPRPEASPDEQSQAWLYSTPPTPLRVPAIRPDAENEPAPRQKPSLIRDSTAEPSPPVLPPPSLSPPGRREPTAPASKPDRVPAEAPRSRPTRPAADPDSFRMPVANATEVPPFPPEVQAPVVPPAPAPVSSAPSFPAASAPEPVIPTPTPEPIVPMPAGVIPVAPSAVPPVPPTSVSGSQPRPEEPAAANSTAPALVLSPDPEATCVGRFELGDRIADGSTGSIYKAYDRLMDRDVMLKVVPVATLLGPAGVDRFLRDARTAARLRHPNIVPLIEAGLSGDHAYVATLPVPGRPLDRLIAVGGPMEPRRAAKIILRLAEALAYAHATGILHGNVTPANILVDDKGEPQFLNFGMSLWRDDKDLTGEDPNRSGDDMTMTPGTGTAPPSDQHTLGLVFFEMLTGQSVSFAGAGRPVHDSSSLPPVRSVNGRVPRDLDAVCQKMIAARPGDRFRDCQVLADALHRFLKGEPVNVRRLPPLEATVEWFKAQPVMAKLAVILMTALLATAVWLLSAAHARQRGLEQELQRAREQLPK